jgi:opacity protein-like surface antigen
MKNCLWGIAAFLVSLSVSFADTMVAEHVTAPTPRSEDSTDRHYQEDKIDMQFNTGVLFSGIAGPKIRKFDYEQTNLRLGWMLNSPGDVDNPFRGNVEAVLELSGSGVFSDYGSVVFGPTGLVRYNFVQPNWFAVPYIQIGAGIVYIDAYETASQRAIGQAFEFTPQAGVGVRFLIDDNWSLDVEGKFHHISNAGIANRNLGVNAGGGFIGFTYFFDKLWKD